MCVCVWVGHLLYVCVCVVIIFIYSFNLVFLFYHKSYPISVIIKNPSIAIA